MENNNIYTTYRRIKMANVKPSADVYIRTQFFEYKFLQKFSCIVL